MKSTDRRKSGNRSPARGGSTVGLACPPFSFHLRWSALGALLLMFQGCLVAGDKEEVLVENYSVSYWAQMIGGRAMNMRLLAVSVLISQAPVSERPKVVPLLAPYLVSERETECWMAALVLSEYGAVARPAVPGLLTALGTPQRGSHGFCNIHKTVALALGKILKDAEPSPEVDKVVEGLIAGFSDPNIETRRACVTACGLIGPAAKVCVPHLGRMLGDPVKSSYISSFPYWDAVAWTCGRMGKPAAEHMGALLDVMLRTESPDVLEAIGAIGPVNGHVTRRIVENMKRVHAGAVKILKDKRAVPMSRAAGRAFMKQGFAVLAKFGPASAGAAPFLTGFLAPGPEDEKSYTLGALKALAGIGPKAGKAAPAIAKLASTSKDAEIRQAAEEALAKIR